MTNTLRDLALTLLKTPTARDLQRLIGPSSLGAPCDYCLARELLEGGSDEDVEPDEKPYWLGAVLGTATHLYLEHRAEILPYDVLTESRVMVGAIPGYGTVSGSMDLYVPKYKMVVDHKTTTREKLKNLQLAFDTKPTSRDPEPLLRARYTAKKYLGQIMLYGKGAEAQGLEVENVGFVFICRDGLTDNDVWAKELPYDAAYAEKVWARANNIWLALQGGRALDSFLSKIACYSCSTTLERRKFSKKAY